jgi:hypothetical protein
MYHKLDIKCPLCKKPITILEVDFDTQGGVCVSGLCVVCARDVNYEIDIFKVAANCLQMEGQVICEYPATIQ